VGQKLTTTFDNLPDTPLSSFELDFNGGKRAASRRSAPTFRASQIANGDSLARTARRRTCSVIQIVGCEPGARRR
jgi:hypothetical protein